MSIARAHKASFEKWLFGCLVEEGYPNSEELAKALMILVDGAVTRMLVQRDAGYALVAARTAQVVLDSAAKPAARLMTIPEPIEESG